MGVDKTRDSRVFLIQINNSKNYPQIQQRKK